MTTRFAIRLYTLDWFWPPASLLLPVRPPTRSSGRGRSATPPPASATTSRRPPGSGSRPPRCRSRASARHSRVARSTSRRDLGADRSALPRAASRAAAGERHKFRFQYIPIKYEQTATLTARHRLQRSAVSRRPAGQLDARLEGLPVRLRVRLRHDGTAASAGFILESKYTDVTATLASPIADASSRSARAPIPAIGGIVRVYVVPEHLDHRRAHRLQAARQARSRTLHGALRRLRHLRHAELHEQRRRAGRLPLARRRLPDQDRHRVVHAEGDVLRGRRAVLTTLQDARLRREATAACACVSIAGSAYAGRHELRQPPVGLGERLVALAEAEPQLRPARRRVLVEAAARHRRHADVLHQIPRELDVVAEAEAR